MSKYGIPIPPSVAKSVEATKVNYVRLGSSGLKVSWPILGTMAMGSSQIIPWALDEEPSLDILKAAYDCGINTWDTAGTYCSGLGEQIIGKAIKKFDIPRHKIVIMTKCYHHVGEELNVIGNAYPEVLNKSKDYINQGGLSRSAIFTAVEASLARLGTTYIDVFQIHRYDHDTPPEETMEALHDLVKSGKVRYIGASSMWATQFARLQFVAEKNGWTKFVSMQNYYNLCYREEEREMIRFCNETGVGIMPWSPLYAGRLARPFGWDKSLRSKKPSGHHPGVTGEDEEIIRRTEKIAEKKGWKMTHVALAWHKSKGSVPSVGLNSVERIQEACEMRDKFLIEDEVKYLEEPYVPRPVVGHD
ncbi:NADP-dependent oxidoreductase domain-containing protein [Truncatella angustata]|uniref:NADP-dependent oxidoreductase domain-containing protein n=1 Tax=Truncatella angustata TaxID=152316 RepID=A0A9P8UJB7_9PEZI|nr:NADP-dependent oxidoreductase domain-containing protein [Truncatella angustata]KAH6653166.1 NADP-dependent oxidoreductase domain-containing protein [Truncatella angustata]